MEARVAAGILLLVTISLAAVVFTATRVTTRSAVGRAADNLEGARAAFYRLVDERAEFAARQTRLITELPLFRSMMINPVIAKDVATLTQMAESYRQNLNAQFAIVTPVEFTQMTRTEKRWRIVNSSSDLRFHNRNAQPRALCPLKRRAPKPCRHVGPFVAVLVGDSFANEKPVLATGREKAAPALSSLIANRRLRRYAKAGAAETIGAGM